MAIEGVVANPGVGGTEFGGDNVSGGSGTVFISYVKLMSGADGATDLIAGDAANGLDVDVTRLPALIAGNNTIGAVMLANNQTLAALTAITNALPAGTNTIGAVALAANSVLAATQSGTWNIGTVTAVTALTNALPAGGNTIGSVGLATGQTLAAVTSITNALPAGGNTIGSVTLGAGVSNIGNVSCTGVTTVTTLTGGGVAHDGADSGNPLKIGAKAESSTAGITLVADADRTDLYADIDGVLITKEMTSWGDLIATRESDTAGTSNAFSQFGATASAHNMVTQVVIHNAHATTNGFVDFRDGTGGAVFFTFPAPATGGCVVSFNPPLRQPTANTALGYDVSAAITTIYISVVGFKSKV